MKSIHQLLLRYNCREIENCPGRYIVKNVSNNLSLSELLSEDVEISYHKTPRARDRVAIVELEDGGVISYIRANGTILHTLNNKSGFSRKIHDLELSQNLNNDNIK